jgi:hypothetical protein
VPAVHDEPLAPPWEVDQPWWAYRSTHVTYGYTTHPLFANWADVMKYFSKALEDEPGKRYRDADLSLPGAAACNQDRRCLLQRALERLRTVAPLTGFESKLDHVRPMKDVLASRHANNFEKAILLRGMLAQAGIASRYAAVARHAGLAPDARFPLPNRFDHLVLEVLAQPGFAEPIIVDPSCEACAIGEIPSWIDRRPITTLDDLRRAEGQMRISLGQLESEHVQPNELHTDVDARLSPTGALDATATTRELGGLAVDEQIRGRGWSAERWTKQLERAAQHHDKTAKLGEHGPLTCDRAQARCEVRYAFSIANYATSDRGELIVPLSFLGWTAPAKSDTPRRRDVYDAKPMKQVETIHLRLPPGWTVGALPSSAAWHSEAADLRVDISHGPGEILIVRSVSSRRGRWDKAVYADLEAAARGLAAIARQSFTLTPARQP